MKTSKLHLEANKMKHTKGNYIKPDNKASAANHFQHKAQSIKTDTSCNFSQIIPKPHLLFIKMQHYMEREESGCEYQYTGYD